MPLLVRHFSLLHFKRTGQLPPAWTPEALETMERYPWPGNVRELANIVERLSIMQPGAEVTGARVREVLQPAAPGDNSGISRDWKADTATPQAATPLASALDDYERRIIQRAIESARGNIAEAARRLQTDRPNLYRRMKRLGIGGPPAEAISAENSR
ncbi:MAG TPA: helix-turn-helix domain-containing protein [Gemmatimonadaceae bacterium]